MHEDCLFRQNDFARNFLDRIITGCNDKQVGIAGRKIDRSFYLRLIESLGERFSMLRVGTIDFLYSKSGIIKSGCQVPGYVARSDEGYGKGLDQDVLDLRICRFLITFITQQRSNTHPI